ncbi:transforming growth factor beta-1-induced transcript 1 protein isoform X3 [Uranotaenia lowii]|uniref:transforming growth factor beta-1-induced transcript 1 protein isoform X3 n=2 Tax=Uranotaenia lowii TaxID=190385 RepID=UPI0024790901|nr:transforming growth factor beta-1-induced transcript 1 protein isoform X3 [Uranotaenia lowii]
MGIFLSVLVASVGAMDLINCLAYVSNQLTGSPPVDADLQRYRQLLKEQIDSTPRASIDGLTYAQDGVLYKDGYRVESFDENRLDALNARIRDLEQTSREKEAKLEQLNEKLQELESHSEEEDIPRDRSRSRSVSRELSPQPSTSSGCVPQIVLDENDMRGGSKKFRPIHRDDEFRRTIKKQSVKSNASEDRADELDLLTQMEEEENKVMDDYIPLVYTREEQMAQGNKRHQISPIQELCHMHENDERLRMERSPEPAFGAETVKPWGDIRLGETKEKEIIHLPQNQLIEEERKGSVSSSDESLGKREDTDQWQRNSMPELPIVQQEAHLTVSEPISSNISSHSGSPDPEHPTLKRTRKKSDLTALLLEEERKDATNSGITIQTEDSENENVNTTEFMQCKSPSPYVENENLEVPCQLIPLIGADLDKSPASESRQSSVSQDSLQPSATQSRDATISPAPIGSSGSPASPNSSILDESFKEHSGDNRNSSSPIESDKNNLIFSGEYTKAMSKDWHSGHFCCWQCDESLTGQRYVLRDEHPYCIKCYENVFANSCEECNKTIGIDSKDLSYKDKHWHEACFLCNKCRISLVDKQFGSKADKIYCGNCYDAQFASRCDGCGEIFRAGTKKMEYKTRQWHEKCFCCCVCKTAIGTKSFIPREQEIYCAGCYEEKYATRCVKCKKIITSGGVTYKNEPWHRECFTCSHCQVSLAGQRFTSRDEKPYCAECFGELFAKRCTACIKPITGIGGTRFISFEDRHWHNDCFICANCKTSLVGRGFITDEQDIICPECAKQKLM